MAFWRIDVEIWRNSVMETLGNKWISWMRRHFTRILSCALLTVPWKHLPRNIAFILRRISSRNAATDTNLQYLARCCKVMKEFVRSPPRFLPSKWNTIVFCLLWRSVSDFLYQGLPTQFFFIFHVGQPARHLPKLAGRFRKIARNATLKQIRPANSNLLWRIYLSSTGRRRFNRRDALDLPFLLYGEVRPPICRLKNGARQKK